MARARLVSVNVGGLRPIGRPGWDGFTAIWKEPVDGRVQVAGVNLAGDDQADRSVHGGPDKAVYSYASEDNEWWAEHLDRPVVAGTFGENLTTADIDVNGAVIGERWRVGTVVLEVSEPRQPCWKLTHKIGLLLATAAPRHPGGAPAARIGFSRFQQAFNRAGRFGAYLRIIEEGDLAAGDTIDVLDRPDHGVTIRDVGVIVTRERHRASELLAVPDLGPGWHEWAREHA
jgi:MOSC domain-containing protein YiiM